MKSLDNQQTQSVAFHRTFNSLLAKEMLLLLAYENCQKQKNKANLTKAKKELDRAIEIANSTEIFEGTITAPYTFKKIKDLIDA